ncbi:hypothetical protein K1W54_37250 [Micromonospora sp. CPCC 205371]|nr:hypothetical protein [Micromonospora sp. CPCC 205371]
MLFEYAVRLTAPDGTTADLHSPPGAPAPPAKAAPPDPPVAPPAPAPPPARAASDPRSTTPARPPADTEPGPVGASADTEPGAERMGLAAGLASTAAGALAVAGDVDLAAFLTAAATPRRIGLLLARAGAVAVGVADGAGWVAPKVEPRYAQGRRAAGGWSQQRFARRRANQAKASANEAADLAVRVLLPAAASLAALVCGGDRRTIDTILSDPRLAPLLPLRADRHLAVAEPRHAVLLEAVAQARAVHILLRDP